MTRPPLLPRLALAALLTLATACGHPAPKRFPTRPNPGDTFAILGDVRPPHALQFWVSNNDRERDVMIRTLAERRPAFVVIHGDFVFRGSSAGQWRRFDRTFAPLRWKGVPILPALGNHEYLGDDAEALRHYFQRFPALRGHRWYRRAFGPVAILVLDSNYDNLRRARLWKKQRHWFRDQLRALDADPAIRGVVVFAHHPVLTNSRKHRGSAPVKRDLLPLFVKSRKTLALVSAHVHTYERFHRFGKMLINTGGGGAPRRRLLTGAHRRHPDDQFHGGALRPFHFLLVKREPVGLTWTVHGLRPGQKLLHLMERFTTLFPAAPPTPPASQPPHKKTTPRTPSRSHGP